MATDSGDAADILGPTGLAVPPRDPEALAAAWERLISLGSDARRALGAKARDRVIASYDLPAIIARYDALYSGFLVQHSDEHQTDGQPRSSSPDVGWTRQYGP